MNMADVLNTSYGKFIGLDQENFNYDESFNGATLLAQKIKKAGSEKQPDGYIVDAIDIDWGGLKLTSIDTDGTLKTISSTSQNSFKGENTEGIHSSGYLLNKISDSMTYIHGALSNIGSGGSTVTVQHVYDTNTNEAKLIFSNISDITTTENTEPES